MTASRTSLVFWLLLYIILLAYSSLALAPPQAHFIFLSPGIAWQSLTHVEWVEHGSDQRADWMANLTTLIPLGFLTAAIFASGRSAPARIIGALLAAAFCLAVILAVKFAQLYIPPRTVTLNYIVAQSSGAAIGIALFLLTRNRFPRWFSRTGNGARLLLILYTTLALLFFLLPFDFVLSGADLRDRIAQLPGLLMLPPGQGRGHAIQLMLALADIAITLPIGLLLATSRRALATVLAQGIALMLAVFALTLLIISAAASLPVLVLHGIGVILGTLLGRCGGRIDWRRPRRLLAPLAWPLFIPYLGVLAIANGLLHPHWRGLGSALQVEPRLFLPLYAFYIVSKAQAAQSVAVHAAMYAPVGVLIWMRNRNRPADAWIAAFLAALLSAGIETARWMQPDRTPDYNEVAVAAFAAFCAVRVLDLLWRPLARPPGPS